MVTGPSPKHATPAVKLVTTVPPNPIKAKAGLGATKMRAIANERPHAIILFINDKYTIKRRKNIEKMQDFAILMALI